MTNMNSLKLSEPYLLVLFSVPYMRNAQNQLCVSLAWAKDLIEHASYIENLTLIAYFSDETPQQDAVLIENNAALKNVRFVMLQRPSSTLHGVLLLPKTMRILWRELKRTYIVHSAVAGWPIPEAWIICPMLWFKKRFHFINVESAFWRIPNGQAAGFKRKIRATVCEYLNGRCIQSADLSTFTQEDYKKSLLKKDLHKGFVIPATWIDADNILSKSELNSLIQAKAAHISEPIKLVFAGRLVYEKGILLLIKAVSELIDSGYALMLDIVGDGGLLQECEQLIQTQRIQLQNKHAHIKLCGTVKYGVDFFSLLHHYDLMVIPSLSDEQPRNVFDAFSQALPVLCADTPGLTQCVESKKTGYFFKTGDIDSLKNQLIAIVDNRQALIDMSENCIQYVNNRTHKQMHMTRLSLIQQALTQYSNTNK